MCGKYINGAMWLVILLLAGCSGDTKVIIPGERVGEFKLRQPEGDDHFKIYTAGCSEGLLLSFDSGRLCIISVCVGPDYHTESGIKLGSSAKDVIACYGKPDEHSPEGIMDYRKLGIEFMMQGDRVAIIHVREKSSADRGHNPREPRLTE